MRRKRDQSLCVLCDLRVFVVDFYSFVYHRTESPEVAQRKLDQEMRRDGKNLKNFGHLIKYTHTL